MRSGLNSAARYTRSGPVRSGRIIGINILCAQAMNNSEFGELRAFVAVAECSNVACGAARLGVVPSTVSQAIKSLEVRLGVRLLNRAAREVALTDAGKQLLSRVRPAIMELATAARDLNQFRSLPVGTLRLSVSNIAVQIVLAPVMKAFLRACPGIVLDVTIDDNQGDQIGKRFDANIRVGRSQIRNLRSLRVREHSRFIAVASPDYLAHYPAPTDPNDLKICSCIRLYLDNEFVPWKFQKGEDRVEVAVNGPLVVNSMELMVRGALEGIAIGYTVEDHVADHIAAGRLIPLLPDWSNVQLSYYLQYCAHREPSDPLKALIAYFNAQMDGTGLV
jgi:DNA-binding transcriptional LysR family regulator